MPQFTLTILIDASHRKPFLDSASIIIIRREVIALTFNKPSKE